MEDVDPEVTHQWSRRLRQEVVPEQYEIVSRYPLLSLAEVVRFRDSILNNLTGRKNDCGSEDLRAPHMGFQYHIVWRQTDALKHERVRKRVATFLGQLNEFAFNIILANDPSQPQHLLPPSLALYFPMPWQKLKTVQDTLLLQADDSLRLIDTKYYAVGFRTGIYYPPGTDTDKDPSSDARAANRERIGFELRVLETLPGPALWTLAIMTQVLEHIEEDNLQVKLGDQGKAYGLEDVNLETTSPWRFGPNVKVMSQSARDAYQSRFKRLDDEATPKIKSLFGIPKTTLLALAELYLLPLQSMASRTFSAQSYGNKLDDTLTHYNESFDAQGLYTSLTYNLYDWEIATKAARYF